MSKQVELAIEYKRQHPKESYGKVSDRFDVPKSTVYEHFKGTHSTSGVNAPRALSNEQERVLLERIASFASRGTLLTSPQVHDLAEAIYDGKLGANWVSRFVGRHKDVIHSRFFAYQEAARLKADTPETRKAFYSLVGRSWTLYILRVTSTDEKRVRYQSISTVMHL